MTLPRRQLRLRFRLIALLSLVLAAAGSFAAVQGFHSARTPVQKGFAPPETYSAAGCSAADTYPMGEHHSGLS
jgi:hypothetical protein